MLAALHTKTGDIAWRKLLEKNDRGSVRFLYVPQQTNVGAASSSGGDDTVDLIDAADGDANDPDVLITVSGQSPALVRGWHALTGHAEFEWTLNPANNTIQSEDSQHQWMFASGHLYHVVPVWGSHLEVTAYVARTGQPVRPTTRRIAAAWSVERSCVLTQRLLVCLTANGRQLIAVDLTSERNELITRPLQNGSGAAAAIVCLRGAEDTVVVDGLVYALRDKEPVRAAAVTATSVYVSGEDLLVQAAVHGGVSTPSTNPFTKQP